MRRDSTSPDAYRADVTGEQRELLEAIRAVILEIDPDVEEGIEYGMLDYPGLANLPAQKNYVSLYVAPDVLGRYGGEPGAQTRGGAFSGPTGTRSRRQCAIAAARSSSSVIASSASAARCPSARSAAPHSASAGSCSVDGARFCLLSLAASSPSSIGRCA